MDELPDKIIDIDIVRANWNFKKKCTCQNRTFVVDPRNREIHCGQCGEIVDPFEALLELSNHYERINSQLHQIYEQKVELSKYKPHLLVIKSLESQYRGEKMLPLCPVCHEPFYLEEITSWTGWIYGEARIAQRREERKEDE